jgi:hypothetical protein
MTTAPPRDRHVPWGAEPLVPQLRGSAAALGLPVPEGLVLDLGAGACQRLAGLPDAQPWKPSDTPSDPLGWRDLVAAGSVQLAIAWPGPGDLPPEARAGWWASLADRLALGGLAAVRLDLLPGWHPLIALQDFARFHAGRRGLDLPTALDQVKALARDTVADGEGHWHGWLAWLDRLRQDDPDALPDLSRAPLYPAELHAWANEAAAHGLTWAGDGRGPHNAPWSVGPALAAWVREEVSRHGLPLRGAQISDYAHARHTRLALFVRGPLPAHRASALPPSCTLTPALDRPLRWSLEPARSWQDGLDLAPQPALVRSLIDAVLHSPGPATLDALAEALRVPRADLDRAAVTAWQLGGLLLGA